MEIRREELYHHGILGQKWGKRNGPPYPLDVSDHSALEKKAGWRKSLNKSTKTDNKSKSVSSNKEKKQLTIEQKKKLAIVGASLVAAGLAVYGGYKIHQLNTMTGTIDLGKSFIGKHSDEIEGFPDSVKSACAKYNIKYNEAFVGNTVEATMAALKGNNPTGNTHNCVAGVGNWILRMKGLDVTTKERDKAFSVDDLKSIFQGLQYEQVGNGIRDYGSVKSAMLDVKSEILDKYPEGASGILMSNASPRASSLGMKGHAVGWKIINGNFLLFDSQGTPSRGGEFMYNGVEDFAGIFRSILDPLGFTYARMDHLDVDYSRISDISNIS